jgi:hypothetical protein
MAALRDNKDRALEVPLNRVSSSKEPELSSYLQETLFCDYTHPAIQDIRQEVIGDCQDD